MRSHFISLVLLFTSSSSSSVDTVRRSLEATSEKWFIWLLVSSGVVAVGCILEIGETWTDLKRWIRLKKDLDVEEENPKSWLVPVGAIGLLLVIIGVIGEGVFEGLASNAETALRGHDLQTLAEAMKEAGDARGSANEAAAASDRANGLAHEAKIKADAVGVEADQAQTKIAGVDRRADVLAYFLSARRVQDEGGLENDLRKEFRGEHIAFDSYVGDEEAYWLCSQLAEIAQKASVDSKDECATKQLSKRLPITDLHINAPSLDEARRLSRVLMKPGRVPGHVVSFNFTPEVIVTVGVKPSMPLFPMVKRAASKTSTKQ